MNSIRRTFWPASDETMPAWVRRYIQDVTVRSKLNQFVLHRSIRNRLRARNWYARRYLSGRGIEIGAQQVPTDVSKDCTVEYVDVLSNELLVKRYGLPSTELVPLTHVIDGNDLSVYGTGELDFLIANHVLEHFDDPVGGGIEWIRILKEGGRLFVTLPNYRGNCYDFKRLPATSDHLTLDYHDIIGRTERNLKHYEDFARTLFEWEEGDPRATKQAVEWSSAGDRHHYHVYDEQTVKDVFSLVAKFSSHGLFYVDGLLSRNGFEFLVVLEKRTGNELQGWPVAAAKAAALVRSLSIGAGTDLRRYFTARLGPKF
jgi:SAM-dependent methyltransferase